MAVEQVAVAMQTEALGKQKMELCRKIAKKKGVMFRVFGVVTLSSRSIHS